MTYNLSGVENATGFDSFFSSVNDLTNGVYGMFFFSFIFLIVFLKVDGDAPTKSLLASFVCSLLSVFSFFAGITGEGVITVFGSLLFLSLLWKGLS